MSLGSACPPECNDSDSDPSTEGHSKAADALTSLVEDVLTNAEELRREEETERGTVPLVRKVN